MFRLIFNCRVIISSQITDKASKSLRRYYCDRKGQGQSNIVFSSSISVADAIRAASELKADLKFSEVETSFVDQYHVPTHF
jgi:hypothetical protein